MPLDEDNEHATYDADAVVSCHPAATRAALVSPRSELHTRSVDPSQRMAGLVQSRGESVLRPPADPPSADFIVREAMDVQEIAFG